MLCYVMFILRLVVLVQAVRKADQLSLELRMLKEHPKESESGCEDENYRIREEQLRLEKQREEPSAKTVSDISVILSR